MEQQPSLPEIIESKEYKPSDEAMCSFLNLEPDELETIRNRLAESEGHLRIWVHPLYTEQWPGTTQGRLGDVALTEIQSKLRATFFKTTDSVVRNLNSSPLVVYEAIKKVEETKKLIADNLGCEPSELEQLGIIFVSTDATSASLDIAHLIDALNDGDESDIEEAQKLTHLQEAVSSYISMSKHHREEMHKAIPGLAADPLYLMDDEEKKLYLDLREKQRLEIMPLQEEYFSASKNRHLEGSNFMVSLYESLGLKSALVSGAYLEVGKNYDTKQPELKACAGAVINYLREAEFPTDISNNIWPPKDLVREAGFEVKQTGQASKFD